MPKTPWMHAALWALLAAAPVAAQETPVAFTHAHLVPASGEEIERGTIVIQGGRIVAIGADGAVAVPPAAQVIDTTGKIIMPGLVDTHSHIAAPAGGDAAAPIQPSVRVLDSIDVRDPSVAKARAGGVTTANVMPGSGHLLSGQTMYLKLRAGNSVEDLSIRDAAGKMLGGMKMANGTNSRGEPPFPGTRGKAAALMREQLVRAQEYRAKRERAAGDAAKMPERDLGLEALCEVLDGTRVVHHHTHRHDDILTVLRLQQEFGFKVVLHHVSEGWKVADEIAKAHVPCSVIVIDSPGGKLEARDASLETCGILEKAGVRVAVHTDDPITDSRLLMRSAALAVRGGMSRRGAIEALTINGARMLELQDRLGSLEPGKDADFVVLNGDPLSIYSQVLETWIEGKRVFDRNVPADRLMAEGGVGAGTPHMVTDCCCGGDR